MAEMTNGQRLSSTEPSGNSHRPSRTERSAQSSPSELETRADTAGSVSLTPSALLQRPREIRVATPPHDAERIAALKQAINSGTYEIDAPTISDRLIGTERVRVNRIPASR